MAASVGRQNISLWQRAYARNHLLSGATCMINFVDATKIFVGKSGVIAAAITLERWTHPYSLQLSDTNVKVCLPDATRIKLPKKKKRENDNKKRSQWTPCLSSRRLFSKLFRDSSIQNKKSIHKGVDLVSVPRITCPGRHLGTLFQNRMSKQESTIFWFARFVAGVQSFLSTSSLHQKHHFQCHRKYHFSRFSSYHAKKKGVNRKHATACFEYVSSCSRQVDSDLKSSVKYMPCVPLERLDWTVMIKY